MTTRLTERARRLLAGNATPAVERSSARPLPAVGEILVPFNCGVYVRPFVVVAQRDGGTLRLLRSEAMPEGGSGGAASALPLIGNFEDLCTSPTWGCPYCHAPKHFWSRDFWICGPCEAAQRPALNCGGCDSQGRHRCACGAVVREFVKVQRFEVRGAASSGAQRGAPGSARIAASTPPLPSAGLKRLK